MNTERIQIPIIGLACAGGDAAALEAALRRVAHVNDAYVNPATETAYLTVASGRFRLEDVLATIAGFGYRGLPETSLAGRGTPEPRQGEAPEDPFAELLYSHLVSTVDSDDERRVARIATETLEAFSALSQLRRAVSVFGSARPGPVDRWGELARATTRAIAEEGFAIITGGGPGLMESVNEETRSARSLSVGLSIQLPREEQPNPHLDLHIPFHYFFLRKLAFVKYACAFVCLPGGYGTLDEMFEALNLKLTRKLQPFPVLLVGSDYWRGLLEWMEDTCVPGGTLTRSDLLALEVTDDPAQVASRITQCHATLCRALDIEG